MDDKDDYIYIKTAMFIATNCKCEEYFYTLFKHDLLFREQEICIKMLLEMLWDKKVSDRSLILHIIEDFEGISTEHNKILQVIRKITSLQNLTNQEEKKINAFCGILKDYPNMPSEEHIDNFVIKQKENPQFAIGVLELVDECYQDCSILRKRLMKLYRKSNLKEHCEKMYQNAIRIMQGFVSEESLYEMARLAILIAAYMNKKGRYQDIKALYREKTISGEHENQLEEFAFACSQLEVEENDKISQFLQAMISEDWEDMVSKYGFGFVKEIESCNIIVNFATVSFVRDAFSYVSSLVETQEHLTIYADFLEAAEMIYSESLEQVLNKFCEMSLEARKTFVECISLGQGEMVFSEFTSEVGFVESLIALWGILFGKEHLIQQVKSWKSISKNCHAFYQAAIVKYQDVELLNMYVTLLFENKLYEEICDLREQFAWSNSSLTYKTYFAVSLIQIDPMLGINYISKTSGEHFINILLLLKKKMLHSEIHKICDQNALLKPMVEMVLCILEKPKLEMAEQIEIEFCMEDQIALLKLLYSRLADMESESKLIEKYGDILLQNQYIPIGREQMILQRNYLSDVKGQETGKNREKKLLKQYNYVEAICSEISLQEYEHGIPKQELNRLTEIYEGLGSIMENTEYRKELLAKMIYIAKEHNMTKVYYDLVMKLGIVLFYGFEHVDLQQARTIMYETVLSLNEDSKRKTVSLLRESVCEMLAKFESVEEISMQKDHVVSVLEHLLDYTNGKIYAAFFRNMLEIIAKVSAISSAKDISQRTHNYMRISTMLQTYITKYQDQPLFSQVYTQWYRIVQNEMKRLSRGAVLELEVETKHCSPHGKICCVLRNKGKKTAEKIIVKAIFGDGIRCRDSEKEFAVLYGGDMITFAFQIRCKEECVHQYRIELTYESNQNTGTMSYSAEIRIAVETEYDYIQNLYSTAPVMMNSEFYGREREKQEIMNFLNDITYNTSIVMHGLKRVGKTSMLRYIERGMLESQIYIPIYKSAQSIGDLNAIGNMFVRSVIETLESRGITDEEFRRYQEYNYDQSPELLYEFYQYLQNSNIMQGKRILFMADEIEEIFDNVDRGLINRRFYKVLRVTLQELTSVRFIFCGADHLTDILYNHALADVFEITKRVIISRIEEEAMRQMIYEPAKDKIWYTPHAMDRIWYYTKGHTFYSKHICSKIIDILNEESRTTAYAYDVDMALKQIMRITEYFIYLSRFFSENDSKVVKLLCDNLKCAGDKISLDILESSYQGIGLTDSLTGLEFKDIIEKTERFDGDYYQFSIEMFRLWYSKMDCVILGKEE